MDHLATDIQHLFDAIAGIFVGIGIVAGGVLFALARLQMLWLAIRREIAKTKANGEKIDLVIGANMRRGEASAKKKSLLIPHKDDDMSATMYTMPDRVVAAYRPIADWLRNLYRRNPDLSQGDFFIALEKKYGNWLIEHVCNVIGVSENECHAIAWEIARSENEKPDSWPKPAIAR